MAGEAILQREVIIVDCSKEDGIYSIRSVWSTEELAEKAMKLFSEIQPYTEFRCEEFEVD